VPTFLSKDEILRLLFREWLRTFPPDVRLKIRFQRMMWQQDMKAWKENQDDLSTYEPGSLPYELRKALWSPPWPRPTTIDERLEAFRELPGAKLQAVARSLSVSPRGRPRNDLTDINFEDFVFWIFVRQKLSRVSLKVACGQAAKRLGDRETPVDTLTKRYRRFNAQFAGLFKNA